jgi:hypothetical protein
MLFTYLGHTKPVIQEFLPLLSRIERRLMGISPFTSYSRRLTLVNVVLSALPTSYIYILELPMEIIEQINKYRRHQQIIGWSHELLAHKDLSWFRPLLGGNM